MENCFKPSASLTVDLWDCGARFVEACGQWEQGTRVNKIYKGYKEYKGIRFEAKAKLKGYVAGNGEAD